MEGEEERCPADPTPMDFSWTNDWEKRACDGAGDGDEAESAPAPPAPTPQEVAESMVLVPGPRVVLSGLTRGDCRADDSVLVINAGGTAIEGCEPPSKFSGDSFFEGGDAIETSENIVDGGDYPSLYHSARYGNFSYKFDGLAPGDYFLDLHFAEIVNTYGPKGIRAFDVLVQEEKANILTCMTHDFVSQFIFRFCLNLMYMPWLGVTGPFRSCIQCDNLNHELVVANLVAEGNALCKRCSGHVGNSPIQTRTSKLISKYEKQIEELTNQCNMKSDECYMAWSSVESTNQELERLKIELHQKVVRSDNIEQVLDSQADQLRNVSQKYENAKKLWAAAISNLENKIKSMKKEQALLSLEAHDCANAVPDLSKMIGAVQALVAQCEDLKLKYYEEMTKRKKLHNIVQETKGNIRVFCRCRPLSKDETSSGYKCAVDFDGAKDGDIAVVTGGTAKKSFKFDRVYMPTDNQVLDGYNVCIFAYGQTGTGKTFTMEGTERNRGVNYRTLEELFKIAEERKETVTYNLSVSVLEVYNEQIRDLLASSPSSKKLEIKQAGEGSHHVPGIVEAKVENIKEVWDVLQAGSNARAVGSNNVNEHSSRSHCMLCIMVRAKNLMNGECTRSKLWLVDLAGSERLAKTDVQGERLKEAQNINRSLSALGDVISALATKNSHIPYRNSKLTHLLQDSLELGPAKRQVDTAELQKVKQMLERARQEVRLKDDSLRKLEDNCQSLENKAKGKEQLYKNLQEKVKELENQLDSKMHSQITSEKQQNQLSGKLKETEEMCATLQQKIAELERKLKLQQQSESEVAVLKQTIVELEIRLREQEDQRSVAESKAMEIGQELLETQRTEAVLQIKLRELENALQERTTILDTKMIHDSTNCMQVASTPGEAKAQLLTREEAMSEKEHHILRSSDSVNKRVTNNSSVVGAPEVVNEKKRKGDARNPSIGGELENQPVAARKRSLQGDTRLKRKSTEPLAKNTGRTTATSKTATATHKMAPTTRATTRQQPANKTRGWVR
uniref:Kinesin motor domain-containing protein n=1 Tax=Oryza brachyantha TaxID=4533 RepID=J3LJ82_ORYBR